MARLVSERIRFVGGQNLTSVIPKVGSRISRERGVVRQFHDGGNEADY